jgi:hypothetical protein
MTQKKTFEISNEPKLSNQDGTEAEHSLLWRERVGVTLQDFSEQIEAEGPFVGATATDTAAMLDRIFAKITGA